MPKTKKRNVDQWVHANRACFLPPVCNKMMHQDGQLKVFFVGGPNQRADYHLEEGEEFFYMLRGDMNLKVLERGRPKDVIIREGDVFLLPGRICHSPQRYPDTVGLVVERERENNELDCLRFYTNDECKEVLFERWAHCDDLNHDLVSVINEFHASDQFQTRRPGPGSFLTKPLYREDDSKTLDDPFNLDVWLRKHDAQLSQPSATRDLFGSQQQSKIVVLGSGTHGPQCRDTETFLWQKAGNAQVDVNGVSYSLSPNDTLLVQEPGEYVLRNDTNGRTIAISMPPK